MKREPLSGEDAAWLHMERETSPMVYTGMLELSGKLSLPKALELAELLVTLVPRLRKRAVEHVGTPPMWVEDESFDFDEHIEHIELMTNDETTLRTQIGHLVSGLLDPTLPLWCIFVIDRPAAGSIVLLRIHHCIVDAFAFVSLIASLCNSSSHGHGLACSLPYGPFKTPVLGKRNVMRRSARAIFKLVTLPNDPKTRLKHRPGTHRRVAWSAPIPLSQLKDAGRLASATSNDVVVALIAGALGRYLARTGRRSSDLELHAIVPVNLRAHDAVNAAQGNHMGLVSLGLPIGIGDPLARVAAVKARTRAIQATPEALIAHEFLRGLGRLPRMVEDLAVSFVGRKVSLVLTDVIGPSTKVQLAGLAVESMAFWGPQIGRMGVGINILCYAGSVVVGVVGDAAMIADPETLISDVNDELAALDASVRATMVRFREQARSRPTRSNI